MFHNPTQMMLIRPTVFLQLTILVLARFWAWCKIGFNPAGILSVIVKTKSSGGAEVIIG